MGSESGITATTRAQPRLDAAAIFYVCLCIVWTIILSSAMIYLWSKRHLPFLAIRGLPLTFAAVICLHLYWMLVQIFIVIGPIEPPLGEYWVMGTWLPWGISLFHAANAQLLHVAKVQKQFVPAGSISGGDTLDDSVQRRSTATSWWRKRYQRFMQKSYSTRAVILVSIAMVVQLLLTLLMYLISRKYHTSWGIPGTEVHGTPLQKKLEQGRGWEWWPGVASQVFWAWVVAPVVLWCSRDIRDTHGWRVQTIACCISGLPATPMWLIALYVPGMEPCNYYFIPPQWICLSIWFIEIFAIFWPIWQVQKKRNLQNETLHAIAQWEAKALKDLSMSGDSGFADSVPRVPDSFQKAPLCELAGLDEFGRASTDSSTDSIYTMTALNRTLTQNPEPLRLFSALRDFSGENIAFLTSVAAWTALWPSVLFVESPASRRGDPVSQLSRRDLFKRAVCIYVRFVSEAHATVPINIEARHRERLDELFGHAARVLFGVGRGAASAVAPFEEPFGAPPEKETTYVDTGVDMMIVERVQWWGEIPEEFGVNVFGEAERSVKYLVLTNTWPKFVKELTETRHHQQGPIGSRRWWYRFG